MLEYGQGQFIARMPTLQGAGGHCIVSKGMQLDCYPDGHIVVKVEPRHAS